MWICIYKIKLSGIFPLPNLIKKNKKVPVNRLVDILHMYFCRWNINLYLQINKYVCTITHSSKL